MSKALKVVGAVLNVAAVFSGNAAFAVAAQAANVAAGVAERREIRKAGADQGSVTDWSADLDAPIPFAVGHIAVAGFIIKRIGYGPTNRYQSLVTVLSGGGPVEGNFTARFNEQATTFGANDVATSGDHVDALWCRFQTGEQPGTAMTSPTGLDGSAVIPDWNSTARMGGKAGYMLTLGENSKITEYESQEPKPQIEFDGLKYWDPRLDSTWPGGSGSCRSDDPDTWVYGDNPGLWALKWAVGIWEGDSGGGAYGVPYQCTLVGGIGSSLDGIDVGAFINAANIADANGWTIGAWPNSKDDKFGVLVKMLQAAGAVPSRKAGKISCICHGEVQTSLLTVTAADTAGPVEITLGQSRLERFNTLYPRHWSPLHNWEMVQLEPITYAAGVTEDRGITRSRPMDYPYVTVTDQTAQLAYYDIRNDRESITGSVPFKPHLRQIEPGDCFTFDEAGFLLDGVKVKCLKRAYDQASGIVRISFRQETDAKHAAALAQVGVGPPATTPATPPAVYVEPPSMFSTGNGDEVISIFWRNPASGDFSHVSVRLAVGSTNIADAVEIATGGLEGLSAMETVNYIPLVAGIHNIWIIAYDVSGNASEALGPESETIVLLLTNDAGHYLTDDAGVYLSTD